MKKVFQKNQMIIMTLAVVIGYDKNTKQIIIRKELYFDQNGKRSTTYEQLLEYIKNIYYVLMTRGIKGTFLYVCDDDLREYLSQYIEVEN